MEFLLHPSFKSVIKCFCLFIIFPFHSNRKKAFLFNPLFSRYNPFLYDIIVNVPKMVIAIIFIWYQDILPKLAHVPVFVVYCNLKSNINRINQLAILL